MDFKTLSSELIYRGRVFDVLRDTVALPDGNTAQLDVVKHNGGIAIVPLDEQGRVWFVRQYRHPAGMRLLELPAGTLEPGEQPEAAAQREVREEIGMAAGKIRPLGGYFLAAGYSSEFLRFFLATDLRPDPLPGDADEFIAVEAIPAAQAFRMIEAGQFQDAKTVLGLYLARPYLP
jgi:ADP-ribose pyrophosphatase